MLVRTKVLLCALSLYNLSSVYGEGVKDEDDKVSMMKNWRKRRTERRSAVKIGARTAPSFTNRVPNFQEDGNLGQTIDIANVAGNQQNRDLNEGFDEDTFWEDYLYTGQVNSLPPTYAPIKVPRPPTNRPTKAPTASPMSPPTKAPVPPPTFEPAPPTEAPACEPICKHHSHILLL